MNFAEIKVIKRLLASASIMGVLLPVSAQTAPANPAVVVPCPPVAVASASLTSELARAQKMYRDGNYVGVIDELRALATSLKTPLPAPDAQEVVFLLGASYFHTSDRAALSLLSDYIDEWPAGENALEARLLRADFFFYAHDWSEALELYKTLPLNTLDVTKRNRYLYRKALCEIKCGFFTEARADLKKIASAQDYALRAKYYLAYLNYADGNDEAAMRDFKAVSEALNKNQAKGEETQGLVPEYYLAQLYFRQGDWKEAASLSASLLRPAGRRVDTRSVADNSGVEELILPTMRIQGMSLYEMGSQSQALPVLRKYVDESGDSAYHDALYALGVCLYAEREYPEAEKCFARVADDKDAIGQGAALYLGQIAAQRQDVSVAAMNFERAYNMNYDNSVAETALYNYVAARARGGNIPFDSNVAMLEEFIRNYPNSEHAPVIERHLATLYYNDGKYGEALRVVRHIKSPSADDTRLLQNILYSGGTSALAAGNISQAITYLKECVNMQGGSAEIRTQARIWLGDALYEKDDFEGAEQQYQAALKGGVTGQNKVHTLYNLGYAQLRRDKFEASGKTFSEMLSSSVDIAEDMKRDAHLRIADSKYYAGRYADAKSDFSALRSGGYGSDYAIYRYAQILGIEGNLKDKIAELNRLQNQYSSSKWMPNVLNELAETYIATGQTREAAGVYSRLLTRYPDDQSSGKARLGMAAALMESGDEAAAVEAYKEILKGRPASAEAQLADKALRDYYAEKQELPEYARFLKSIPGFSIDAVEMERLSYDAAERKYLSEGTIVDLRKYLKDYPGGANNAEAWLMLAQYYQNKDDRGNALAAYRELERIGGAEYAGRAYAGIMRMADNSGVRAEYARKLREAGGASGDIIEEADFYLNEAKLLGKSGSERAEAERNLRKLAENPFSEFGARSAVAVGEYLVREGRNKEALELMQEFTSAGSGQQYWVARGFLVMADAYAATGDKYTAEEYVRSLQRNYPGNEEDIRRGCQERLSRY